MLVIALKVTTTKDEKKSVSGNVPRKKDVCRKFFISKYLFYILVFLLLF